MIEKLRCSVLMISNGIDAERHSEWENRIRRTSDHCGAARRSADLRGVTSLASVRGRSCSRMSSLSRAEILIFSALSRCIHRRRLSEINRCIWRINISSTFSHNGANKIYGGSQSNASCRMSTSWFREPKYEWPKSDQFHAILDRQPAPIRHLLRQMPNFGN